MSPDTTDDPEALFEHLCTHADPRRVAQLKMFRRLCLEHHARGSLDFRSVTIAALTEKESNYAYASLRSNSGKPYRQYIAAFARSVGGYTHKPALRPTWRSAAPASKAGDQQPPEPDEKLCAGNASKFGQGALPDAEPRWDEIHLLASPAWTLSPTFPSVGPRHRCNEQGLPMPCLDAPEVTPEALRFMRSLLRSIERKITPVLPEGEDDAGALFR